MQKLQQKQSHEETPATDEGTNPAASEEQNQRQVPSPKSAETPKPVETPKADKQPAETTTPAVKPAEKTIEDRRC